MLFLIHQDSRSQTGGGEEVEEEGLSMGPDQSGTAAQTALHHDTVVRGQCPRLQRTGPQFAQLSRQRILELLLAIVGRHTGHDSRLVPD